ncbi:MAG: PAS domain-containing protein [Luteitalea sp.]|nr:PAS domain-containing protein [Luteitalea sp.]
MPHFAGLSKRGKRENGDSPSSIMRKTRAVPVFRPSLVGPHQSLDLDLRPLLCTIVNLCWSWSLQGTIRDFPNRMWALKRSVAFAWPQWRPNPTVALLLAGLWVLHDSAPPASAQLVGPPVSGYVHDIWTTQHGLPQNQIRTIVQTRDGYLWIGTGSGLVRFDGVEFTVFDVTTTPELPANWISALYEDRDGALWIGTDAGLVVYLDRTFARPQFDIDTGDNYVHAIEQDASGRLWVAIGGQVLCRTGDQWTKLSLGDVRATGLLVDRDALWIGTTTGLIEWRGRVVRTITTRDGLPEQPGWIEPRYAEEGGPVWVHTPGGLVLVDRDTKTVERAPEPLAQTTVLQILKDRSDRLWMAARGALFEYTQTGKLIEHPVADQADGQVTTMLQDREGHFWFGMSGGRGGLHRLTPERVTGLTREHGLPCDNVMSITQGPDGTVWVGVLCGKEGGLLAIKDGQITRHRNPDVVPASLLADPDGSVWVGTFGGELFHVVGGGFTRYTVRDSALAGEYVVALHRDHAGALWIGTDGGLHRYHDGRWAEFRTTDGLVHDDVRFITTDRRGALWIGTRGGVSRYAGGRFTNLTTEDGLPRGAVRAIYIDREDTVWIGTYGGGLCRLKDGQVTRFGTLGGLLDNGVHRILEDDQGNFWMTGDQGIRRVSRRELNDFADGKVKRLSVSIYDEHDGMKNAEANGMAQPAGWRMRDGSLWFPTQGGIARIDPAAAKHTASPPPVIIEEVLVNETAYDTRRQITAPPGSTELEIHYTAPAFSRPEQIQFRYRLEGHDTGWVDAGTRRVAHYANLAPGSYRFQVVARNSAGLWSETGATTALVLRPHFYQRPTFYAVIVLLVAAVGYLVFRLRVVQLRERARWLEAVVSERTAELGSEREGLALANQQMSETNAELSVAKEVVETSHAHLVSVLDQLQVGVIVVDHRERVRFVSRATQRLIGGANGSVDGRSLDEVLPISAEAMTKVRTALLAPRVGARVAARLAPSSGPCYWTEIEVRIDPRDERHRILYLYDVTEAYDLERAAGPMRTGSSGTLIGSSAAMRLVHAQIRTMAGVDATVLIEGETGTGKELVARSIHEASSRRARQFLAINCAGLTESLLASQLFGHKRGAFTGAVTDHVGLFESAQGGTLLLDEIGDMPMSMQTHLLRVLQEREIIRVGDSKPRPIDVRVLASTHRSLEAEVSAGRFREDLLYRIRVTRILLPPLRLRTEDIPQLTTALISQFSTAHGKSVKGIAREAMDQLLSHRWPGNVRELRSAIEWAVIRAAGPVLKLADLPPELSPNGMPRSRTSMPESERRLLIETLNRTGGNRSVAARLLGVSRATLYRRLAALDEGRHEGADPR